MQQFATVRLNNQNLGDVETQSVATNATRFVNYRVTSRNAFLGAGAVNETPDRNRRTLLVPDTSRTQEEQMRQTFMTNFSRSRPQTVQADEQDGEIQNSPEMGPEGQSNGFSAFGGPQNQVVAKYKILKDNETIGDAKLIEQESKTVKHIHNIVFFF